MPDYTPTTERMLAWTVIDHFHAPDVRHAAWWLNTDELAEAFAPILADHDEKVRQEVYATVNLRPVIEQRIRNETLEEAAQAVASIEYAWVDVALGTLVRKADSMSAIRAMKATTPTEPHDAGEDER